MHYYLLFTLLIVHLYFTLFPVHVSGTSLSGRHDLNVVQADVGRTGHGKYDRVGDVFSRERCNSLVHVVSGLLVTFVAYYGEFGFNHSRGDVGYLDVVFQHIDAHGFRKGVHGVLGGTVDISTGVNFLSCHGGQVDDCLLYTSPSPRDRQKSRMPSSA